jgi:hypothetical protein
MLIVIEVARVRWTARRESARAGTASVDLAARAQRCGAAALSIRL